MKFSIITPSFRNSKWLKLCIPSVADQEGVQLEHIVQDSCSDDGTGDWLPQDKRVKAFIEKDSGMYDAVNRGYRRAEGDVLAYLNCDEQYLPGALKVVQEFFERNPNIEVLLGACIVVDSDGNYLCHRHALVPSSLYVWHRFPVLTCSVFLRRNVMSERKMFFDTKWRDLGDFHWVLALMNSGVRMAVTNEPLSVFTDTGDNMNLKANAQREKETTRQMMPAWAKVSKPLAIAYYRLLRVAAGHFSLKPTAYSIYTPASPDRRVRFDVPKPTAIWRNRL